MGGTLLDWYDRERRRLPWREEVSPYRTWVSEIMLQQTQVATVIPYFERFMRRFPDLETLASADEEEVLRHWAGLGYYSRARNLHGAAREVIASYGGRVPDTPEGLMALPGIGRYTAAAIASIAFDKPHAVLDGNVVRVLSRFFAVRGDPKSGPVSRRLWELAESNLDRSRPGDWNQAMMELGARVCLPERPQCGSCPVAARCEARRLGLESRLPESAPQREPVYLSWTALWAERDGKVLLWRRAPDERFLRNHWGLPETRHLPRIEAAEALATVRHSITHHRITLTIRRAAPGKAALPPQARWVPYGEIDAHLVSSLWRKAARGSPVCQFASIV